MQIEIITRKVPFTTADHERSRERTLRSFRRFADEIQRVLIRLNDINGLRGGVDKRAVVEVHLRGGGRLAVERLHEHAGGAVAAGLEVIKSKLRKRFGERSGSSRRTASLAA